MGNLNQIQKYLLFTSPDMVDVVSRQLPVPTKGELLVRSSLSAVSGGTESLIFRGLFPAGETRDATISALKGNFDYPFQYGYSMVGRVVEASDSGNAHWISKRVFAFQPHASSFLTLPEELLSLPAELADEDAVFLPNMETAVNLVMDGAPVLGEKVAVIGLGVVGLLTTSILGQFPLERVVGIDLLPFRRSQVDSVNMVSAVSPENALKNLPPQGYDLIYELSGSPAGLNLAIELAGFESRIVIGSWYGNKTGSLDLGGKFHRSRIMLISSQVSTIASHLTGRWTKKRRFDSVFQQLAQIRPSVWITHRFPLEQALIAYQGLVSKPEEMLQVVFTYEN